MTSSTTTSAKPSAAPASSAARALTALIGGYRRVTAHRVAPCRFYPSCSAYALEAVETHGAARGSWLALRRLSKCRPFGPHGVDLVPPARGGAA
jgi:uncharacterized protein